MRHSSRVSPSVVVVAISLLTGVSPLYGQRVKGYGPRDPNAVRAVAVAALRDISDYARHSLRLAGPLLVDSVAFGSDLPTHSARTAAQSIEPNADVLSPRSAITCAPNTLRCSIKNEGILMSLQRVVSAGDTATADVTLKWTVHSPPPRGDNVALESYRLQLVQGPRGWSVVTRHMIDQN